MKADRRLDVLAVFIVSSTLMLQYLNSDGRQSVVKYVSKARGLYLEESTFISVQGQKVFWALLLRNISNLLGLLHLCHYINNNSAAIKGATLVSCVYY